MEILNFHKAELKNVYQIFCATIEMSPRSRSALYPTLCKILPNATSLEHRHFEGELFYIISGQGMMKINEENKKVYSGDLITIPSFAEHSLKNIGLGELCFLSVYSEDFALKSLPERALITAAPPTPNGPLHLGHISGPYLSSDVLHRYFKLRGIESSLKSGTDDYQNYVLSKALRLQNPASVLQKEYRGRILNGLKNFNIQFDEFIEPSKTFNYKEQVQSFFQRALDQKVFEVKEVSIPFCESCELELVDGFLSGNCPFCGAASQGICENCGQLALPWELKNPHCHQCKKTAASKIVSLHTFPLHRFLPNIIEEIHALNLSPKIRKFINNVTERKEVSVLVSHPDKKGYGIKAPQILGNSIHVWTEMAAQYESFSLSSHSWIHHFGFDNSFYYVLFIPALLRALNPSAKLFSALISNEFLYLEGEKFSTSRNHAIWADEIQGNDALRLFLCTIRPEKRISNFDKKEMQGFLNSFHKKEKALLSQNENLLGFSECSQRYSNEVLVFLNRVTRDLEEFYSPYSFNLRRASFRVLELIDFILNQELTAHESRVSLKALATVGAPLIPELCGMLLKNLEISKTSWQKEWSF